MNYLPEFAMEEITARKQDIAGFSITKRISTWKLNSTEHR